MDTKVRQDIALGSNIRTLRRNAHLTQEQMAAELCSRGAVKYFTPPPPSPT